MDNTFCALFLLCRYLSPCTPLCYGLILFTYGIVQQYTFCYDKLIIECAVVGCEGGLDKSMQRLSNI